MSDNTVTMKSEDVLLDLLANRVSWPCLSRVDWTRQNWHNLQSVSDRMWALQNEAPTRAGKGKAFICAVLVKPKLYEHCRNQLKQHKDW